MALHQEPRPLLIGERINTQGSKQARELVLARRYDALVVDVDLLSHRLGEAGLPPDEAALLGRDGGRLRIACDDALVVPSPVTARIQEVHQMVVQVVK